MMEEKIKKEKFMNLNLFLMTFKKEKKKTEWTVSQLGIR